MWHLFAPKNGLGLSLDVGIHGDSLRLSPYDLFSFEDHLQFSMLLGFTSSSGAEPILGSRPKVRQLPIWPWQLEQPT